MPSKFLPNILITIDGLPSFAWDSYCQLCLFVSLSLSFYFSHLSLYLSPLSFYLSPLSLPSITPLYLSISPIYLSITPLYLSISPIYLSISPLYLSISPIYLSIYLLYLSLSLPPPSLSFQIRNSLLWVRFPSLDPSFATTHLYTIEVWSLIMLSFGYYNQICSF